MPTKSRQISFFLFAKKNNGFLHRLKKYTCMLGHNIMLLCSKYAKKAFFSAGNKNSENGDHNDGVNFNCHYSSQNLEPE
jgi:hypothetical protein